jgi:hypothetical protein
MKGLAAILVAVLVVSTYFGVATVRAAPLWSDTFSDSTANGYTSRWSLWQFGVGNPTTGTVEVDVGNNRLLMTITGGAPNTADTCGFGVKLNDSIISLQGDFVMQVHYELISWNLTTPYCRCALGDTRPVSEDTWMWGERISENPHYGIDSHLEGSHNSVVNNQGTTATSGDIRLVRVGNVVTEYYKDSTVSDWTASGYSDQGTGNLSPQLGFWVWWPGQTYSGGPYQVAFSDFEVVSGTNAVPEYPYGALALLAVTTCVTTLILIKRRHLKLKIK